MTRRSDEHWDLTGVRTETGLDRAFASAEWQVPAELELRTRVILRQSAPPREAAEERCLHWRFFRPADRSRRQGAHTLPIEPWLVRASPGLLDQFVRLTSASDREILQFACRWGVLGLCEHGLPASHQPPPHAYVSNPHLGCRPVREGTWDGVEPLNDWRSYARRARGLLDIAAAIHGGRRGPSEQWQQALEGWPRPAPANLSSARHMLEYLLELWLYLGNVRPVFRWPAKGPRVTFGGAGLVGAIALQLSLAVSRTDGLAVCSNCAMAYLPSKRPAADRRRYCLSCRKAGAPLRDAQRARRARLSANRS